jgi:hypothetical protein
VGIAIATAITGVIVAREIETATETETAADEIDTVIVATVVTEIAIEASAI